MQAFEQQSDYSPLLTMSAQLLSQITESAGMYYTVVALLLLVIFFDFFLPDLNDAEKNYLKRVARSELLLVFTQPLGMLLALGVMQLVSGDNTQYIVLINAVLILGIFFYPGFTTLRQAGCDAEAEIRFAVIRKTVRRSYVAAVFSLYMLICALTGPETFNFLPGGNDYTFPLQSKPPLPNLKLAFKDDAFVAVDLNRGYLTDLLHYKAPESVFFLVMFYLSHLYLAVSTRCVMFFVFFAADVLKRLWKN